MGDVTTIDPGGAVEAAAALGHELEQLAVGAGTVERIDRTDGFSAPVTTRATSMLDELLEEVGLLRELLVLRAALAVNADRFDGGFAAADLAARFAGVFDGLGRSLGDEVGGAVDPPPWDPSDDWDADRVREWWEALSVDERGLLVVFETALVGNTDGVPFGDRAEANRLAIQRLLDDPDHDDPGLDQFRDPAHDGAMNPFRQVVVFDPADDGVIAEVFGDLATAEAVAVIVPGMASGLGNFGEVSGHANTIWGEAEDLAVIAWTGYDAPFGLAAPGSLGAAISDVRAVFEVATEALAIDGGRQLVDFGVALGLETDSPTTYIGHSYGSLTLGHAIRQGLTGAHAVFVGSPGVGVDSVDEFPDGAFGEYFAADAHGDPIADLELFGDAPTDPDFGAHVYDVGEPNGVLLQLHDDYFDSGTATDNLRTIICGGDPSDDRPPLANYVSELMDDLDLPGESVVENVGAHVEEAVLDTAGRVADVGAEVAGRVVDLTSDASGYVVDGAMVAGETVVDGVEVVGDTALDVGRVLTGPFGWPG